MIGSQRGSLLEPARHLTFHPGIVPTDRFTARTTTLPRALSKAELSAHDYDLLLLDIQGTEGLALTGALPLLPGIAAVMTEVNYAQVYAGCALITDIDDLLLPAGFRRVEETSPHHHGRGDALYAR